jgi:hypothetical protein
MAKARSTDPETSHEAGESIRDVSITQATVLELFIEHTSLTDLQLEQVYNTEATKRSWKTQTPQSLRSRRSELVTKGHLEFSGAWGESPTGLRARIWKVVSK